MKPITAWLDEYAISHQNPLIKMIHWICVPSIFFSIIGMFYSIPLPASLMGIQLNVAYVMLALVTVYYALLSRTLWIGMLLFSLFCLYVCSLIIAYIPLPRPSS